MSPLREGVLAAGRLPDVTGTTEETRTMNIITILIITGAIAVMTIRKRTETRTEGRSTRKKHRETLTRTQKKRNTDSINKRLLFRVRTLLFRRHFLFRNQR